MEKKRRKRGLEKRRGLRTGIETCTAALLVVLCLILTAGCHADRALSLENQAEEKMTGDDPGGSGEAGNVAGGEASREEMLIYVHVCGAVNAPGLLTLPAGSRAWDALEKAGGFAKDADQNFINLAAFLTDGQKLYVPKVGEVEETYGAPGTLGGTKKVDLNLADEAKLQTLPGIGSSRASAILKYRRENGGFQSVDELLQVPGIKEGLYEQIKDLVTVG